MRSIEDALKAKYESARQTAAANADPSAVIWISRPTVALTDPEFLERKAAGVSSGLTAIDVAMRRTRAGREPDTAFVAYVADGAAGVRSGNLTPKISDMLFNQEAFSESADDVAVAFDGRMLSAADGTAQFVTDERPWIFWTKDGVLKGRILGLLGETVLAASNCSKVTAIRATGGAQDFGLVVFFLLNGAVYYRQLISGVWTDAEPVTFGPSGVTWADIAAFRTWDYRVGLQCISTEGDVYELFTQFMGIARHGAEHVSLKANTRGKLIQIQNISAAEREHVSLAAAVGAPYGGLYRTGAPGITAARNEAQGGDFGRVALFTFDRHLRADEVAAQPTAFRIVDSRNRVFVAQTAQLQPDGLTVRLSFLDFNSADGVCKAAYVPGTVHSMAGDALTATEFSFTPAGLVPPGVPEPAVDWVANTDDFTVLVTFDRDLTGSLTGAEAHFAVQISRPAYSPGGALSTVTLAVQSVTADGDDTVLLHLASGNLTSLQTAVGAAAVIYDGAGPLTGVGGPVAPFTESFTPALDDFKPDVIDAEHVELAAVVSAALTRIYTRLTQETEHISLAAVTASGTLTHVDDL